MAKAVCSGSIYLKVDISAERDGDLMGKKVYHPLSHANTETGATALSPRSSIYPPAEGSRASGSGTPTKEPLFSGVRSVG